MTDPLFYFQKPEIGALVNDLGLVRVGRPYKSRVTNRSLFVCRPRFCDKYKAELVRRKQARAALCRELYKRNKPGSRYVYASFADSPKK